MALFKVELDLSLHFWPMDDRGDGIMLMRTLELPFAPANKLMVFSKEIDECPEPLGFCLGELVWDMDRRIFLAKTGYVDDTPIAMVPFRIADWLNRGWRLGSYMDSYRRQRKSRTKHSIEPLSSKDFADHDEDEMDTWPSQPPSARPAQFNRIFDAMIRTMAELHSNSSTAYAMSITKRLYSQSEVDSDKQLADRWNALCERFNKMSMDQQLAWRDRMMRRAPSLAQLASCMANAPSS